MTYVSGQKTIFVQNFPHSHQLINESNNGALRMLKFNCLQAIKLKYVPKYTWNFLSYVTTFPADILGLVCPEFI